MDDPRLYWIGFSLVKGIGAARMRLLLDHFGDLSRAWHASPSDLQAAGLSPKLAKAVEQARSQVVLEKVRERLDALNVQALTWEDPTYPRSLKEVAQPPPVLYVRGSLEIQDEWAVGVVGTRRVTAYGRQVTEELCSYLASQGITVISGLARGVDSIAHQAALNGGGRTIGVLGSGVDSIYPPENRRLAEAMQAHGAVISDYPLGTPPDAANFPPRNRIISGLARAVVVIEAGETSGALITAAFAADQGRAVFAVPGNIFAPQSKGANILIQQGARPLLKYSDLLADFNLGRAAEQRTARTSLPSDSTEQKIYDLLGAEPLHVDEIRQRLAMPVENISAALILMELKGMVRQVGGMNYTAIREEPGEYS